MHEHHIVIGEAARLPVRCRVTLPPAGDRPNSGDPEVAGAWSIERKAEDYGPLVAAWRGQRGRSMERKAVNSSNVLSYGYDPNSEILEVEFRTGIYEYLNVPQVMYDRLEEAESKGNFINTQIKPAYACNKL